MVSAYRTPAERPIVPRKPEDPELWFRDARIVVRLETALISLVVLAVLMVMIIVSRSPPIWPLWWLALLSPVVGFRFFRWRTKGILSELARRKHEYELYWAENPQARSCPICRATPEERCDAGFHA